MDDGDGMVPSPKQGPDSTGAEFDLVFAPLVLGNDKLEIVPPR